MKTAHQGVPISALPSGVWRDPGLGQAPPPTPQAPALESSLQPPAGIAAPAGAPLTINQAGQAIASQRPPSIRRDPRPAGLVPPADIPKARSGQAQVIPQREKNLLEKLFGG